jgi:UrcA family protein
MMWITLLLALAPVYGAGAASSTSVRVSLQHADLTSERGVSGLRERVARAKRVVCANGAASGYQGARAVMVQRTCAAQVQVRAPAAVLALLQPEALRLAAR